MAADSRSSKRVAAPPKRRKWRVLLIADSYIGRQVAESSARGLAWFAGLFLLFAMVASAKKVGQDGLPWSMAAQLLLFQLPRIVLFTIPASLLYGTVGTFVEMSSRGEITALWAGGMSLKRMLRAPLGLALVMACVAFWLQEVVVPGAETQKTVLMRKSLSTLGVIHNFKLVDSRRNGNVERILQAQEFDSRSRTLKNPVIQIFREDNTIKLQIKAQRAEWDEEAGQWKFYNGSSNSEGSSGSGSADGTFSIPTTFEELVVTTDQAPALSRMNGKIKTLTENLAAHNYEMVSLKDLTDYRTLLLQDAATQRGALRDATLADARAATYGIHDKFATPLVCLAFVLVAAPLGIRPQRGASAGLAMGLSLAILMLYYLTWSLAAQWGKGGAAFPLAAAYAAVVLTGGIGAVAVARKG